MADTELEKQGYSFFERLMFVAVPILFTVIFALVLLTMFDADVRNSMLRLGNSIPIVKNVVPDPKVAGNSLDDDQIRSIKMTEKINELEAELSALKQELEQANASKESQHSEIEGLMGENAQLKRLSEEQQLEDEQYAAKIQELASMFSKMTPSKAAPIVQNMTIDEIVLLFSTMRPEDRVRIMEKMNPKIAADATMKLKDNQPAKDLQIAALQSRLDLNESEADKPSASTLDDIQLNATFSSMNAKSAGEMLLKLMEISPNKVLRVLNAVEDGARSSILAEMSKLDEAAAAQIVSRLMTES